MHKHQPNIFFDLELHYSGFFLALGDEPVQRLCRVVDQQAEYRKAHAHQQHDHRAPEIGVAVEAADGFAYLSAFGKRSAAMSGMVSP